MPRKNGERLNVDLSKDEMKILDEYCEDLDRNKTDVIREFVRSLEPRLKRNQSCGSC